MRVARAASADIARALRERYADLQQNPGTALVPSGEHVDRIHAAFTAAALNAILALPDPFH